MRLRCPFCNAFFATEKHVDKCGGIVDELRRQQDIANNYRETERIFNKALANLQHVKYDDYKQRSHEVWRIE